MKLVYAIALAIVSLALVAPAHAQVEAPSALEWAVAQGGVIQPVRPEARRRRDTIHAPRGQIQTMIASAVCARIGCQWTATALRIAKIESGFRCAARNRRAVGIFQTTNPAMFGVSRRVALTCGGGIAAGVAHMALCIQKGARSARQMMVCHNTGNPYARRVERAYRVALGR